MASQPKPPASPVNGAQRHLDHPHDVPFRTAAPAPELLDKLPPEEIPLAAASSWRGWLRDFIAGTLGGVSGIVSGQPLDTVRVRLQAAHRPYKGAIDCMRITVKEEGIRGLFRGMVPPMLGAGAVNAVLFSVWGRLNEFQLKSRPVELQDDPTPLLSEVFYSGFGAGLFQCLIISPADLIKIKLQAETDFARYKGPLDCTRKVVQEGGVRALFRGFVPTVIRDAPSFGAYFWVYEYLKRHVFRRPGEETTSDIGIMASGSIAGIVAWLVCYPIDLVKSRMQADRVTNPEYKGMFDCFRKSYREGGNAIFWRGLGPTLVRATIVNGPTFYIYEFTLELLDRIENPDE